MRDHRTQGNQCVRNERSTEKLLTCVYDTIFIFREPCCEAQTVFWSTSSSLLSCLKGNFKELYVAVIGNFIPSHKYLVLHHQDNFTPTHFLMNVHYFHNQSFILLICIYFYGPWSPDPSPTLFFQSCQVTSINIQSYHWQLSFQTNILSQLVLCSSK